MNVQGMRSAMIQIPAQMIHAAAEIAFMRIIPCPAEYTTAITLILHAGITLMRTKAVQEENVFLSHAVILLMLRQAPAAARESSAMDQGIAKLFRKNASAIMIAMTKIHAPLIHAAVPGNALIPKKAQGPRAARTKNAT